MTYVSKKTVCSASIQDVFKQAIHIKGESSGVEIRLHGMKLDLVWEDWSKLQAAVQAVYDEVQK
jgi:hypothetical protein